MQYGCKRIRMSNLPSAMRSALRSTPATSASFRTSDEKFNPDEQNHPATEETMMRLEHVTKTLALAAAGSLLFWLPADAVDAVDAAANALARKGTFVPFKPAGFEKVPDEAKDPTGAHIAQRLNMMTIFVRTDKIPLPDGPKTWSDALNPKYKGQMVMTDPSFTSLQLTVIASLSKKFGWEYYEKLRQNDIMIVQGNQQVSDMMKRGERIIAIGALDSYAADDRKAGHPIATVYPTEGSFIIPSPTSIVKGSPNPNAAKLFAEFMLSEPAQKLFP